MRKFSTGRARVLIATDVASRGIDVDDVGCVIHYDPPENGKAYKHRSGRTARAGSTGTVVSLVQRSQNRQYRRIQTQVGIRCEITNPEPEILDEREFVLVPPEKSEGKRERHSRNNSKRSRRSRKSKHHRGSNKSGDRRSNRRRKGNKGHSKGRKKANSRD
tara:strand:- start:277 stop:759 length:483 start_codon:yes stop_codon:yes gene_type:complete